MKSISNDRPAVFQDLGDGSFYYNFNIQEIDRTEEDGSTQKTFECETVHIWGEPTKDKCTRAVIRDRRDETEEFNLINRYNAYKLGLSTNQADENNYLDYLAEIAELKNMVDRDF